MSVRSIVFVKSALFFKSALRSNSGSFPAEALGTAAEGLLYSDAAFANAVTGTKGGTLD
jgi:hypothetical protein